MVTQNLIIWWIDAAGILHTCSQITEPPTTQGLYAQGKIDPVLRTGTISHICGQPAHIGATPRGLLDALHNRFPHTRWWIPNQPNQQTQTPPTNQPDNKPVPAHS
ncbi:MAG: hypothetical protein JJ974_00700 [Phycisphaerales bacterium]|nr:hypothetical protein [Phycisphaerales bacterium]